jgi:drug/metabolite transporter (DMT)-like permease
MIGVAMVRGERPKPIEWIGLATALGGLIYLVLPGLSSPPLFGSVLMISAGAAWGAYSLRGKASRDPLAETTGNFVRAVPFAAAAALAAFPFFHMTVEGMLWAILSGAIASGLGYAVWYAALKFHTPTRAAVLQLLVPVIAAFLAVLILSETADMRLVLASSLVIGGIGLTIFARQPRKR